MKQTDKIIVPRKFLLNTFRGKCFVCTNVKHIAFWIEKESIKIKDNYLHITINYTSKYQTSNLYKVLNDDKTKNGKNEYIGFEIIQLFGELENSAPSNINKF